MQMQKKILGNNLENLKATANGEIGENTIEVGVKKQDSTKPVI